MIRNAKLYLIASVAIGSCVFLAGWPVVLAGALAVTTVALLLAWAVQLHFGRARDRRVHAELLADQHSRTIEALALAVEAKDDTTHDHLRRVQVYALELGRDLGLTADELQALRAAAVLHDIGKLAVPESIISKPGKLTPEEFEKMKIHPVVGAEILERVQFPYPVAPIVRSHHEKWDGTGYPDGLRGEQIPAGARILAAVDMLDALASDRQYRRALPLAEAMHAVEQEAGKALDPAVVAILGLRYVELEQKAQMAGVGGSRLSLDMKVERGAAPAAGFETAGAERNGGSGGLPVLRGNPADENWFALLRTLVPFDALALYRLENDTLHPEYVKSERYGRLFSAQNIPVAQGLSGWVAENRKPILNGNPSVEPGFLRDPKAFSTLRSALSVPLQVASMEVVGVLTLYCESADAFTKDQLRLLESIAPRLAVLMEPAHRI